MSTLRSRWIGAALTAAGVALGFGARGLLSGHDHGEQQVAAPAPPDATTVWTCSMHPQIRMERPGRCPICGMDLVPITPEGPADGPDGAVVALGAHARAMARVEAVPLEERLLWRELRTVGKVALDETAVAYITARVEGRVDQVFADFPGTVVERGDHLVQIYSPDLYATQQEYLASLRSGIPAAIDAARRRLLLWGITEAQVDEIARTGAPQVHLTVFAPMAGTILEKGVRPGQYVRVGDPLYTIADLSRVWIVLEVYEDDLAWVRFGQPVELRLEGFPARRLEGAVGFVEPVLTEETRTVRVRVMAPNDEGLLRPGMFVQATIRAPIAGGGEPGPTGLEGRWVCPMHPMVIQAAPGPCPLCGMDLVQVPGAAGPHEPVLAVPTEAVLTTGRRQLVFVEEAPGRYRPVEPSLGPRAGDFHPVLAGLRAGQRVVVRGNFLIDSQLQISGRPSLLHPEGHAGAAGHDHGGPPAPPRAGSPAPATGHDGHEGHEDRAPPPAHDECHEGDMPPPPLDRPAGQHHHGGH
ncbi:MAG: efflux RND transporter periplasmic adaptor subunit [Planctomycetes bacterium]|nr:efflux RND transporter periplasmic adaptor subunit [Planctomycetota bacterium]